MTYSPTTLGYMFHLGLIIVMGYIVLFVTLGYVQPTVMLSEMGGYIHLLNQSINAFLNSEVLRFLSLGVARYIRQHQFPSFLPSGHAS